MAPLPDHSETSYRRRAVGFRAMNRFPLVIARAGPRRGPLSDESNELPCLSSRGAKRRGDPSEIALDCRARQPGLAMTKPREFIGRRAATKQHIWHSCWN